MANRSAHEASLEGALRTSVEGAVSVVIVKGVEVSPPPGLVCGKSSICAAPMNGKGDSVPAPKQAERLQEPCRNVDCVPKAAQFGPLEGLLSGEDLAQSIRFHRNRRVNADMRRIPAWFSSRFSVRHRPNACIMRDCQPFRWCKIERYEIKGR